MNKRNLQNTGSWLAGLCCFFLIYSSCTAEIAEEPHSTDGMPAIIRAEIDTTGLATRADDPTNEYERKNFITNDQISISKIYNGSTASPVFYKMGSDSEWAVVGTSAITLQAGATYQAKFPINSEIKQNQSTAENYLASNLLQTKAISSRDGVLNFTGDGAFVHQNTKITLAFTGNNNAALSTAVSNFSNFTISANGLRTGKAETKEEIVFYRPEATTFTWCGIVYPKGGTEATTIALSLTYNEVTYKTTISCPMEAGTHYKYKLQIKNDYLVPTGTEITGWTNETVHTGDFDTN